LTASDLRFNDDPKSRRTNFAQLLALLEDRI